MRAVRFDASERGQSVVEVALLLPLLVFVLLGGADLARAFAIQLAVQNGARAGAEAAAMDFAPDVQTAIDRAKDEMSRTPALNINSPDMLITVTFKNAAGTADCSGDPTVAEPCYATVHVHYVFRTVTPWPLIPNTAIFERETTYRTIKAPQP
jgi:Flp pilus assembly protein TadG